MSDRDDATERRRAADAQAQLASIVQSSHDAIVSKDLQGIVTHWNAGAERLYGYRADEIVERPFHLIVPESLWEDEDELLDRLARGERVARNETRHLRKDGTSVSVSVTMSPIVDVEGTIIGTSSTSRDISDQQRAKAMFTGLVEAAADAIVGVDSHGRIALVNLQTERLFGYAREELVGQSVEMLVPEASRGIHPTLRATFSGHAPARPMGAGVQLSARRRDGTEFPADISLSTLETDDGVLISASIRDVTERIEAQREREKLLALAQRERLVSEMHQSQRLESLGQLAGGIAHDFNNLLAVIINYAVFVREEAESSSDDTAVGRRFEAICQDVAQIERAGERATLLTHQLLAFASREVVRPEVIVLNDVVIEVEQLLLRTLGEHVEMTVTLDGSLCPVLADPGQIEQVLVNLAVNARDAMPTGGTLTIDTQCVTVDDDISAPTPGLPVGLYARLRISDTGSGMPLVVATRAFEPFFTTKPKGEGTGLGLATVYGIVSQADGWVRIYSETGIGTTISIWLPATDQPVQPLLSPIEEPLRGGTETILLVEDEDAIREVTRRILVRHGYVVITAAGGLEALAVADRHLDALDLLLTDVVMPLMLGKEVADEFVARRPDLPVLYMSGYARPVLAARGTLDDGVTLLEKPFSEATLLAMVREVLDR